MPLAAIPLVTCISSCLKTRVVLEVEVEPHPCNRVSARNSKFSEDQIRGRES